MTNIPEHKPLPTDVSHHQAADMVLSYWNAAWPEHPVHFSKDEAGWRVQARNGAKYPVPMPSKAEAWNAFAELMNMAMGKPAE